VRIATAPPHHHHHRRCSYVMEGRVIVIAHTDRAYPKQLAFAYLADVARAFAEELARERGDGWEAAVDSAARAYSFVKFGAWAQGHMGGGGGGLWLPQRSALRADRHLKRLRSDYADPSAMQVGRRRFVQGGW
jgi:hypothetical protein